MSFTSGASGVENNSIGFGVQGFRRLPTSFFFRTEKTSDNLPSSGSSPNPGSPLDGCQRVELSSPKVSLDPQIPIPNQLRQCLFCFMYSDLAVGSQFPEIQ